MKKLLIVAVLFAAVGFLCLGANASPVIATFVAGAATDGLEWENGYATLKLDDAARVVSLREKTTGRELAASPEPFFRAEFPDGKLEVPSTARLTADGLFEVHFSDRSGALLVGVDMFHGGWTFEIVKADVEKLVELQVGCFNVVCRKYHGALANMASDDFSGVCVRGYSTTASHKCASGRVLACFRAEEGIAGQKFGLVAGPRSDMTAMLRGMTLEAGVPRSPCGGAWALGADENRISYLISDAVRADNADEWLSFLRRTGIGTFHIRSWWGDLGWYSVKTNSFPRELADIRDVSIKAHAAGFRTSMHTLTGCVSPNAPWIAMPAVSNLMVCHTYTLARPIPAEGEVSEIFVSEKPASDHGYDFSTWSRGNTMRIGTELFQYDDISFEPPYKFTGVKRRAFNTAAESHPVGARADYLWCYFANFLAEPGTPLANQLAGRIARVYHAGGFDQIYLDGADGLKHWPSKMNGLLRQIYASLVTRGHPPHYEDSKWTTGAWWFHSRIGAWDYTRWSPKTYIDRHVRLIVPRSRRDNLLEMNLGWWPLVTGSSTSYGYTRDEVEYFGAKIVGHDASFSMVLPGMNMEKPLTVEQVRQATQLGWYERPRVARAFDPAAVGRLAEQGSDFRLRQGADGRWMLAETEVMPHRMGSPLDRVWNVRSGKEAPAALRVRILDSAAENAKKRVVMGAEDADSLAVSTAKGVEAKVSVAESEHGKTIVLLAKNKSAPRNGSWVAAEKKFPRPFMDLVKELGSGQLAVCAWVKGDGSGATLNLQMRSPKSVSGATSEHYVKLDFKGWRRFVFSIWRDHDAGAAEEFSWPYMPADSPCYIIYERALAINKVEFAALWLNGVKPGTEARAEVAGMEVTPSASLTVRPTVSLGGVAHSLPFDMTSGESAELECEMWTLYSLEGEPLKRVKATGEVPRLSVGENRVEFSCGNPAARAEVTVTGFSGVPFPAFKEAWTVETRKQMSYEAAWPELWAPSRGFSELQPVRVRPGETARISVEIAGRIARPVLMLGGERREFPVVLGSGEVLRMEDGVNWRVEDLSSHSVREKGHFLCPLPLFSGEVAVAMDSADSATASARLCLTKNY